MKRIKHQLVTQEAQASILDKNKLIQAKNTKISHHVLGLLNEELWVELKGDSEEEWQSPTKDLKTMELMVERGV
ncbi:hypothetical protein Lal_00001282 [Lupinus albus]|nr:hypothetical protein Lal_00001282 [Lupinus albus]